MIFLIEYDRGQGRIVSMTSFRDSDLSRAEEARLTLELKLNRAGVEREVVLLDAADEPALHRTHRRYFADVPELARALRDAV